MSKIFELDTKTVGNTIEQLASSFEKQVVANEHRK